MRVGSMADQWDRYLAELKAARTAGTTAEMTVVMMAELRVGQSVENLVAWRAAMRVDLTADQ